MLAAVVLCAAHQAAADVLFAMSAADVLFAMSAANVVCGPSAADVACGNSAADVDLIATLIESCSKFSDQDIVLDTVKNVSM